MLLLVATLPPPPPPAIVEPCPDSRFDCVTLSVPRDHAEPNGPQWEVTFAIQRAAVEHRGTFVTLTGGPGSSGIALADTYTDYMAPAITDYFDIVFVDQRGTGFSEPIRCDAAVTTYYLDDSDPFDPAQRDALAAATETFVNDCITESEIPTDDLPYFATRQATEDLEVIRQYLGEEQLTVYGESYGTQYAQYYAAAYPENVRMLVLDGVVDLTLDVLDYYEEGAHAYDDSLVAVLDDCTADAVCGAAVGGDALAAYGALAGNLAAGPMTYEYAFEDGTTETRTLTATDLELATTGTITSLGERLRLQQGLALAMTGDVSMLDQLADEMLFIDSETQEVIPDPSWSDAAYFAIECQDYEFLPDAGTPRERLDAWIDHAVAAGIEDVQLDSIYFGDLPCVYWPNTPANVDRPAPITDPPYPTLVLNADTDGPTAVSNALRVYSRLDNAALVLLQGGPHVIFDWGYECVDSLASEAIVSGELPDIRVTICGGEVADPYESPEAYGPDTSM